MLIVGTILSFLIYSSFGVLGETGIDPFETPIKGWIIDIGEISGGNFIKAEILNGHHKNLTNVEWSIRIDHGYIFYGREKTGVVENIPSYNKVTVKSFVFGFGTIEIYVHAKAPDGSSSTGNAIALIFGPFTFVSTLPH